MPANRMEPSCALACSRIETMRGLPGMDKSGLLTRPAARRTEGRWRTQPPLPILAITAAITLAAAMAGCTKKPPPPAPPTVYVATPLQRKLVDWDDYVGRFVAVNSVD